jgi:hypothetical protein
MFASNRLTLFLILLLTALFGGARVDAANNPPPCYDPWVCDFAPVIGGTISGPSAPCHDETVTYRIIESKIPGQRSHCKITNAVNATAIGWDWTLTGPESDSGFGDSFNHTFKHSGVYTVTFTGEAGVDGPTCYPDRAIVSMQVTIEGDSGTVTLPDAEACRGDTAILTWTIKNTGHCKSTFDWVAYATEGRLDVTTFKPLEGSVTLEPQESRSGTIEAKIAADSPYGVRGIELNVSTPVTSDVAHCSAVVELPKSAAKAHLTAVLGCRGENVSMPWTIRNTGDCRETFTWQAVATVGDPTVTINVATGTVTIDAKMSESGGVPISIAANSLRGVKTIHLTVIGEGGAVVWTGDGTVEVPPAKITVSLDDATDVCPDARVDLPFQVTNHGKCTETITLKLTQIAGKPLAGLPPDETISLAPRGVKKGVMTVRLGHQNKGVLTFKLEVFVDGNQEDSDNAKVTQAPVTVELKAEGGLTECMEGRGITFTAAAKGKCWGRLKYFTFYYQRADGTSWESREWTYSDSVDNYAIADQVPNENNNHFFATPVTVRCEDTNGNVASSGLKIKVYQLWITKFGDAVYTKPWKVRVGELIEHDAIASADCKDFVWDMEDGTPDAWNPTGGTTKKGTRMQIPYSDESRASNSWFGDTYGTVTVSCKDGEDNSYIFRSTSMKPSMKAKVFFEPTKDRNGKYPYANGEPPAWFYFWKDGLVIDGMDSIGFAKIQRAGELGFFDGKKANVTDLTYIYKSDSPQVLFDTNLNPFIIDPPLDTEYINQVASTMAHENYHKFVSDTHGTDIYIGGDQDLLPDDEETTPRDRAFFVSSSPTNNDTFKYGIINDAYLGATYVDQEVRCREIQWSESVKIKGMIHYEKDWAADQRNPQWAK